MITKIMYVMAIGCALTVQSFAQQTENMPQAPQIVMPLPNPPEGGSSHPDGILPLGGDRGGRDLLELNFARPVQFAWLPCTSPNGVPLQVSYTLRFWRLMGMHPAECIEKMPPTWEVKNLIAPQLLYNRPASERVAFFPEGEVIAMQVVATAKTMTGQPVKVINDGISPYALFRVVVDDTAPVVEKRRKKKR